jgi:hypothetical protein
MIPLLLLLSLVAPAIQSQPAIVSGQLSKDGKPIAGIRLIALEVDEQGQTEPSVAGVAVTDAEGRYRFASLPPGRYYVAAGVLETPTYYPGVMSMADARLINVEAGASAQNKDFAIAAISIGFTVSGRVVRPGSQPAASPTTVALVALSTGETVQSNRADEFFEFTRVRPGTYGLRVTPAAFVDPVEVNVVDADLSGVEIVVPLTITAQASIVVEGGGMMPALTLSFAPYRGGYSTISASLIASRTLSAQLLVGEYRVGWSPLPEGYSVRSITVGSTDLLAGTLKIAAGDNPRIVVNLAVSSPPPWVKVSGRVTGLPPVNANPINGPVGLNPLFIEEVINGAAGVVSTGNGMLPLPRLTLVKDLSVSGGPALPALPAPPPVAIEPDGVFEIPMVPAGNYRVMVEPSVANMPPISIAVGKKDQTGVAVVLPGSREVAGKIEVEGGGPVPQLTFLLSDAKNSRNFGRISPGVPQAHGAFTVKLPEGEYRVTFDKSAFPEGYTLKSARYGAVDLLSSPLRVATSDTSTLQVTFSTPSKTWFKVSGRASGPGINDAAQILLTMAGVNGGTVSGRSQLATIGPAGAFEFPGVFPGTYTASVSPATDGVSNSGVTVTVGNADVSRVEIFAPRYVTVTTYVSVDGNGPVPIIAMGTQDVAGTFSATLLNEPTSGGAFRVALPEGEHRVQILKSSLPAGYAVKSFTADSVDLLQNPLNLSSTNTTPLRVTLSVAPNSLFKITGRVIPMVRASTTNGPVLATAPVTPTVRLSGAVLQRFSISIRIAPIAADGTFEFTNLPPGTYSLFFTNESGIHNAATVTIIDKDITGIEFGR